MYEKRRIDRNLARTSDALAKMEVTEDAHEVQDAWELYVLFFRTTFNLMSNYSRKLAPSAPIGNRYFAQVSADQDLSYLWEARNAEEHKSLGSGDPALMLVEHDLTDQHGDRLTDQNGDALVGIFSYTVLQFRDLTSLRGKHLPAPSKTPLELSRAAHQLLKRFYDELFP